MLAVVAVGSSIPTTARGAVNLPGGSCFDARYFDGLSSAGDAYQCATAIKKAGYNGSGFTNASAKTALIRLGLDGVFHFSGHSVSAFQEPAGATGLLFESPQPGGAMDVLLGDPAGIIMQGPVTICSVNGGCRSGNIISYPWANLLAKYNLVVLQSCQTAKGTLVHPSIAQYAKLAGAGTSIGFAANTTSPSSWASSFFGQIGNHVSYATAAASAAGACCGYGSWRLFTNIGAPTGLYPRGYYIPPARIPVPNAAAASTGTASSPAAALNQWLGDRSLGDLQWTSAKTGYRTVLQAYRPGVGLFQVDPQTMTVTQAIFEPQLFQRSARPSLTSTAAARLIAESFAASHFAAFDTLVERSAEHVDHEVFDEYRFTWQAQQGDVWLPTKVSVGINSTTGQVAIYNSERAAVTIPTQARVAAKAARSSATRASRLAGSIRVSQPVLEVRLDRDGIQRLVWVTEIETVSTGGTYVPDYEVMWTDAISGESAAAAPI